MGVRPDVELRVPADGAYVAVLRVTMAGLAARLDFTLDDIEDLKIAVGEACAMVLDQADASGDLYCSFRLGHAELVVSVSADSARAEEVDRDSFGWLVLNALSTEVTSETSEGRVWVTLTMRATALV